ncbi:hypothetical protein CY35_06G072000 [Sphagnum magellanicum]|nr:hypothetical protein CY35_06G072000 [Sphagnum magellanicum]KAH9559726.1 hypothetical protein CY35_06G072000 [Sphagnum magellanicum]KAH9559727.1 hypothetical protein CY35_06G072000 [Sphagnum magellanicum]KAH9559728.1 hypothetical protein CY35_06G072000 [Sphagnum magellanicum]
MGDPASWPQPSGLTPDGSSAFAAAFASARQDDAWWAQAELRTSQLIACIQPTRASEERRQAVADYVQRLIHQCFKCQVVTFGSVPLKTYLPDGDIDLTALSQHGELKETWAEDVHSALRKAEKDSKAEFRVKEVQYIHAEVKIIKCLVENIVVDISFNQTGGLCTLCFLEEVDRCINRNHLFKRSVILVKAWCYYESRILGAHHALISTYALETLVLYVFHVFHSSLRGPLEVLYTFLEYFSNFDWDKYCVSLWGPVPLSSLPGVAAADGAEPPRKNEGALLLTKAFLDTCSETYSVVPTTSDNQTRTFNVKFLNVLDPLRESNNLGRSVSKGNFYRIRSAFGYGARKLAGVLKCSKDNINAEVERFFSSTLERSCSGGRLDAAEPLSHKERTLVGIEKENGGKNLNSHTPEIYNAGPERLQLQYGGWPGLVVSRPRDALDPAQLAGNVDGRGSFRNSGNLQKAVDTSFGSQQGKWQSLEPGPRRTSSAGKLTAALSETHPRQVDGMLEFMNAEAAEKTRVLNRGPNTGNVNALVTESPIDHNHDFPDVSQLMSSRKDMGGSYFHQKESNHDSMLHISSMEDLALKNFLMSTQRQGDTGASSNATNYYIMGMPGSSAEAAAVSSQENLHHATSHSGDHYVGLSSVRKASPPTVAEGGNWIGEQTTVEMMGAVDSGHHHVSHERVSQSVLWPPPFIQRQSYHHDRQAPSIGRGGNQHGTYRQYDPYGRVVEGNSSFIQGFEKNCSIPGIDCNEVYQMSAPWYHVGPVQEDKAEPQAQNSNAGMSTLLDTQSFETERVLDKTGLQQHVAERRDFLLGPSTSLTPVSVPILPVPTGGVPGGRWPLPHHKNSYWNPTGLVTPGPHAPQAYPHDSGVVHSTDSLEFGSFGPVLFGDMRISSTQLQLTQAYISGTPGTSGLTYSSGDRAQLSSSPKQR